MELEEKLKLPSIKHFIVTLVEVKQITRIFDKCRAKCKQRVNLASP